MKKILGISLVALFTAVPLMAEASNVDTVDATGNALTTQSYVKGAFNVLARGINSKQDQIKAGTADVATSIVLSSTVHEATAEGINSAADNAMISEKAALTAIQSAVSAADGVMDARVDVLESAVNDTSTGLATKASQTDLNALASVVNDTSTGLATKASQTALNALSSVVNDTSTGLATKASASDLSALSSVVNDTSTGLATKASQTALNALDTRVTNVENSIGDSNIGANTTITGAIAALQSTAGNLSATYQAKSDSEVAAGTHYYIQSGTGVAGNLVGLDDAVHGLATTTVQVATAWGTEGEGVQNRAITALNSTVVVP